MTTNYSLVNRKSRKTMMLKRMFLPLVLVLCLCSSVLSQTTGNYVAAGSTATASVHPTSEFWLWSGNQVVGKMTVTAGVASLDGLELPTNTTAVHDIQIEHDATFYRVFPFEDSHTDFKDGALDEEFDFVTKVEFRVLDNYARITAE